MFNYYKEKQYKQKQNIYIKNYKHKQNIYIKKNIFDRESAAKFMAHAHTSVNIASRHYLSSERRYNYTTPKSFLEQISLYTRLLKTKAFELRARVARLENGLDKLRSTAVQVDKLKKKLAVQEVELQQKNEAADTLIAIVGVETEKVQKEKAIGSILLILQ